MYGLGPSWQLNFGKETDIKVNASFPVPITTPDTQGGVIQLLVIFTLHTVQQEFSKHLCESFMYIVSLGSLHSLMK